MNASPPQTFNASAEPSRNMETLSTRLSDSLEKTESKTKSLSKTNNSMMISGLVCSAGGTLVAGITSAQGPIIGVGIPGWRISCTIAAILGFFTTIIMGLIQQMRFGQRLGRANEALGRLKALEFEASTGGKDLRELWQEYGDILRSYPEEVS